MGRKYQSIVETIGNTPVVRINRLAPQDVNLFVKIEAFNPLGSVKDRLALGVIEAAEKSGELKSGQTVIEATSGNTGIGLAMVCAAKGGSDSISMKFADGIALFSKRNQRHANQFSDFCPLSRGSDCRKRGQTRRFHPCNRSGRYPSGELSSVWIAFATRSQSACS
jgi:hypothetical protein